MVERNCLKLKLDIFATDASCKTGHRAQDLLTDTESQHLRYKGICPPHSCFVDTVTYIHHAL